MHAKDELCLPCAKALANALKDMRLISVNECDCDFPITRTVEFHEDNSLPFT